MIDEKLLKNDERAIFNLRSLYRKYGYAPFKMSKFEEYELYVRNKDFLVSDRVITFNDTNGKLMALKPDVTLSIIKNSDDAPNEKKKVFYNENVYRISKNTHRYKEIMQAGLECIGDLSFYDIYEVISLAAETLAQISDRFVLNVSHLGILQKILGEISPEIGFSERAIKLIEEKNGHDLIRLCSEYWVGEDKTKVLTTLVGTSGERNAVLSQLEEICSEDEIAEMKAISKMLDDSRFSDKILFDFSVVNNMNYYSGFVFRGFVDGICDGVLAGGQYDRMMEKMGRKSGAIGFALYLDLLEQLKTENAEYDVDVLLIYDDETECKAVADKVGELISSGKTVSAQKTVPEKLRYKEKIDLRRDSNA
ncbi:MAG TPA: hypothetical protein DCS04_01815 [Ruminococcaceae bacterium]|nr:hypothetical protein [Oscillospiraceae bacterium]